MVNRTDQAPRWIKMLPEATTQPLRSVIADLSDSPAVLPGSFLHAPANRTCLSYAERVEPARV